MSIGDDLAARNAWVARVLGLLVGESSTAVFNALAAPPPAGGAPSPAAGAAVRLAKGLLLWNSTRTHVAQQVKLLQQAILAQTVNEADHDEIAANLGNLDALLEELDDSLSDTLGALRATTDPARKQALSDEARNIIRRYRGFAATNDLINDIDDNGFVALDIKAQVTATLDRIAATI